MIALPEVPKDKTSLDEQKKEFELELKRSKEALEKETALLLEKRIELRTQERIFEEEEKEVEEILRERRLNSGAIRFNVGGKIFYSITYTLTRFEQSLLASIFTTDHLPKTFASEEQERLFHKEMEFFRIGPQPTPFNAKWNTTYKSDGLTVMHDGKHVHVSGDDGDHLILVGDQKITKGSISVTFRAHIPRPNRYSIGVLLDIPQSFNRGFAYKNGLMGWGLHDHTSALGIYCQSQLVAPSTLGYNTNDLVTMNVDVDKGDLVYKVNGLKCAELLGCEMLTRGVWVAVTLFNNGARWKILS
ncbi:uncharacterized protein MONOS_1779 [Monocercomonoides exilis]|uniref:uncharacterized protein n=1 Tax=Monocercomonoides exilis TaxID=2049356 RepID=UPI00355A2331|nr:hypothetical protein MONOS_1779 [Monocercomonoides exilis]|eukprot:MONOS_1779.1-p1 / transcript=MONOS_1779.1 / gene=MONOS_1779 / organism=Monocercomonoides_exilis_PA203 / gene_product=unspecified product / transcript_product=unspecified product / location=Mono_scaffold00033:89998-91296(-) / protein_length=302 / sequence_SO=supercontig / SO=protein_coding / is_pseudo=false